MGGSAEKNENPEVIRSVSAGDAEGRRRAWRIWAVGAAFLAALLALFYPKTTIIADEMHYLSGSQYFLSGKAFDRSSEAWFWKQTRRKDGESVERTLWAASPTFSVLLIPFVAAGWHSAFVLGTVAQVLAFGGMIYVLRRRGLDPLWATLYLLHPTLVLYSRTVMADVPSSALVVLVLVLLHRERPAYFLAGLVMGFMMMLKMSNLPVVAVFALVTFARDMTWRWSKEADGSGGIRLRWLAMGLGMLPAIVGLALINAHFFNSPFGNGYREEVAGFSSAHYLERLLYYAGMLMLFYPLMLAAPVFLRGRYRWEMRLSCLGVLLFFSACVWVEPGNSLLEAAIRALRYQTTALPFYIVAYAAMIPWLAKKVHAQRFIRAALATAAVLLGVGAFVISQRLFDYSGHLASRQEALDRVLPRSGTVVVEARYLSAVTHPELRLLRAWENLTGSLRQEDLPALLVLESGQGVRTAVRHQQYDAMCAKAVARVREDYEVRPYGPSVEGIEIWEIVRKLR